MGREFTQAEQDAGWPTAMKPRQLAGLQRPWRKGDAQAVHFCTRLLRRIEQACKDGLLLSATEDRPLTMQNKAFIAYKQRAFALGGTIGTSEPIFKTTTKTELKAVTVITAQAFAAWLTAPTQDETPSPHVAAWFEAVGVNHQSEAATDETLEARNDRWLAFYEAEVKAGGKRGAYERGSKHFNVDRSKYNKAVKKAAEKRAEKLRAGIKAVSGKAGDWTRQLVINGKKTKGTKA
jgi:hypothetical protein